MFDNAIKICKTDSTLHRLMIIIFQFCGKVYFYMNFISRAATIYAKTIMRKVDRNVFKIVKECNLHLLQVFYQEGAEMLRLKVIDHPEHIQQSLTTQKCYYYKDYTYAQMPNLIRINFSNLKELFEQIQVTSSDCLHFDPQKGLQIDLQVGNKVKHCLFVLSKEQHTYVQTLQGRLWKAENEIKQQQSPQLMSYCELVQMRAVNNSHAQQIVQLQTHNKMLFMQINAQREERRQAELNFQATINQIRAEIYELRSVHETVKDSQQQTPKPCHRVEISSLICEERAQIPLEFISIDDDNWLKKIEQHNNLKNVGIGQFKFKLDQLSASDVEHAFERVRQRVTYKKRDQKHRQFTSLTPLTQPFGLVSFKLLKTKDHNIYVGAILGERQKMTSTTREGDALSYKLSGSGLWEDNVRAQINLQKIQVNQILTMVINTHQKTVQWWKFGELIAIRPLPYSFQQRKAFPFVNMMQEGDCIEFV